MARLNIQYAHRFYGFKGEAQYLHGHTGGLTLEVGARRGRTPFCVRVCDVWFAVLVRYQFLRAWGTRPR